MWEMPVLEARGRQCVKCSTAGVPISGHFHSLSNTFQAAGKVLPFPTVKQCLTPLLRVPPEMGKDQEWSPKLCSAPLPHSCPVCLVYRGGIPKCKSTL